MKKVLIVVLCTFLVLVSFSVIISTLYVTLFGDEQILVEEPFAFLNYNNISAGHRPYWVTNDKVYFSDCIGYSPLYYEITRKGKNRIAFVSGPNSYGIQAYGDNIYIYDISQSKVRIRTFNASTKKKISTIFANKLSVETDIILQCFIIDNDAYVLTHENSVEVLTKICLDTNTFDVIYSGLISVGVMNNSVVYITEKDNIYSVFKYDSKTLSSIQVGEFVSDIDTSDTFLSVNYTSDSIILCDNDYDKNISKIIVYNVEDNALKNYTVDFIIDSIVAYEKVAFCVVKTKFHDETSYEDTNALYKINICDCSFEKLDDVKGMVDIFVASDEDVFVTSTSFEGLRHYKESEAYVQTVKAK